MSGQMVTLTDAELLVLDGRCSEKVQDKVDAARSRVETATAHPDLSPEMAGLIADVVTEAKAKGLLLWRGTRARLCRVCGKSAGYAKFKSGPRKGSENYDKPLTFPAVEMADRFVRVSNHVSLGACSDCAAEAKPHLVAALAAVRAQVPADLAAAGRPAWKRYGVRTCPECGWTGHEGEMRQLPTLMPGGTYPGGCPSCEFESRPFGKSFEFVDAFEVVAEGQP
jgi:hypothetical protein